MIKKIVIFLILLGSPLFFAVESKAFTGYYDVDSWTLWSLKYELPALTETMELYIPSLSFIAEEYGTLGYRTALYFHSANGLYVEIIPLEHGELDGRADLKDFMEFYGRVTLDLLSLQLDDYPRLDEAVTFGLSIVLNQNFPNEYVNDILIPWFNDNFYYSLDGEIILPKYGEQKVLFYDRGSVYFTYNASLISGPLEPPEPYRFGYDFQGWFEHEDDGGLQYYFDGALDEYIPGVQAHLYARWERSQEFAFEETTLDLPDAIMNALGLAGLNTVGGRTLIYFIIVLILTVSLLLLNLSPVIIISVNFVLSTIFMFMGWFPIYMIVILGGALLFGFMAAIKGGM